jgi:hypothetical protein
MRVRVAAGDVESCHVVLRVIGVAVVPGCHVMSRCGGGHVMIEGGVDRIITASAWLLCSTALFERSRLSQLSEFDPLTPHASLWEYQKCLLPSPTRSILPPVASTMLAWRSTNPCSECLLPRSNRLTSPSPRLCKLQISPGAVP